MRWYRGQPGTEDPGYTAKKFARQIEERSDRKAPVFIAKLFTKIKKQRASSVSKITVFCWFQPQETAPQLHRAFHLPQNKSKCEAP